MTERMRRVNASVRQVLSEAVRELKDPRIGFVTVTGVETTSDLRHAKVFVSVMGSEDKQQRSLEGLAAAARRAAGTARARAANEADPATGLPVRSVGRARRSHDETHR